MGRLAEKLLYLELDRQEKNRELLGYRVRLSFLDNLRTPGRGTLLVGVELKKKGIAGVTFSL